MICSTCLKDKPETDFGFKKGSGGHKKEYCLACARIRRSEMKHLTYAKRAGKDPATCKRKWVHLSPEEKALTFYARHAERAKELQEARRKRDAERIRAHDRHRYHADTGKQRRRKKLWVQMNPHKVAELGLKRRVGQNNAQPRWLTAIQKAEMSSIYNIARAKSVQTGVKHHVDHILALQHPNFCGLHVPWNLQILTAIENFSKGNKIPPEFAHLAFDRAP